MSKNIFEIWDTIGERIPFAVRRDNWGPDYYTVVVKVEINKYPYGNAYGYTTENGKISNHYEYDKKWRESGIIPCCGCYQWTLVDNADFSNYEQFLSEIETGSRKESQKKSSRFTIKTYEVSSTLGFGKYKGKSIQEIFDTNPSYLEWCINNLNNFHLSNECILALNKLKEFNFSSDTIQNNEWKKKN